MTESTTSTDRPQRPRRRLIAVIVVVLLVAVLAAAVVAADIFGRRYAQERAAGVLQQELGTDVPPEVIIDGVPFLTQVVRGELTSVQVTADQATIDAGGTPTPLEQVSIIARQVRGNADWSQITAGQVDGSAHLPWTAVSDVVGAETTFEPAAGGAARVKITRKISFQGLDVPVVVIGTPRYDFATKRLQLDDADITVATYNLPDGLVQELLARAMEPLDLNLPAGLELKSIRSTPEGLRVHLAGRDVQFG